MTALTSVITDAARRPPHPPSAERTLQDRRSFRTSGSSSLPATLCPIGLHRRSRMPAKTAVGLRCALAKERLRSRTRHTGQAAHYRAPCNGKTGLPALCFPPTCHAAIPPLTFFPLALPDRNAYKIFAAPIPDCSFHRSSDHADGFIVRQEGMKVLPRSHRLLDSEVDIIGP